MLDISKASMAWLLDRDDERSMIICRTSRHLGASAAIRSMLSCDNRRTLQGATLTFALNDRVR